MRHTDSISIGINGRRFYEVPAHVVKDVEAILAKARAKALSFQEREYYSAEELFPDLFDPVMGPAKYLRGARLREGLTQTQLAKKTGIKQNHISEMERYKRVIGKDVAQRLAKALNCNWRNLISG